MKRFLTIVMFAFLGFAFANAQSTMTDDQVLQYVIKEHDAGTSQAQIVTKLMQKGVDISQIRRIRQKYERQLKNGGLGIVADESVSKAENTLRKNNGDAKKAPDSQRTRVGIIRNPATIPVTNIVLTAMAISIRWMWMLMMRNTKL